MYGHFGEVVVVLVAGCDPGYEVLFLAIGVVEIERLVEEVVAGAGDAAGEKRVEGIVILDLASAGVGRRAIHYERAVAGDVTSLVRSVVDFAAGKEQAAGQQAAQHVVKHGRQVSIVKVDMNN